MGQSEGRVGAEYGARGEPGRAAWRASQQPERKTGYAFKLRRAVKE